MRRLHLFYPANDLALADFSAGFTPPRAAMALEQCGSTLPMWYGAPGDMFISQGVNARWFDTVSAQFGLDVQPYDRRPHDDLAAAPWGWSPAVCRIYESVMFPASSLPDRKRLENLRALSHRRTAAEIASCVAQSHPNILACAREVRTVEELEQITADMPRFVVKIPWSSSGRGVIDSASLPRATLLERCEGTIRRQGSVMVEPYYDRLADFALLLTVGADGKAVFTGYSLFEVNSGFAYAANIVASDSILAARIPGSDCLGAIIAALTPLIEERSCGIFAGPLGIDMMAVKTDSGVRFAIAEINWRMTMGYVAHRLVRFIPDGRTGRYAVTPAANVFEKSEEPEIVGGLLHKGTLDLAPVLSSSQFRFTLTVS